MPAEPLSLSEREEIRAGIAAGESLTGIAAGLGRHRCTVSAEVARNGGRDLYRASAAEKRACRERARPKMARLVAEPALGWHVTQRLLARDSPMTISIELARGTHGLVAELSHEAICQAIYARGRRGLSTRVSGLLHRRHRCRKRRLRPVRRRRGGHRWGCSTRSAAARPSPQAAARSAISRAICLWCVQRVSDRDRVRPHHAHGVARRLRWPPRRRRDPRRAHPDPRAHRARSAPHPHLGPSELPPVSRTGWVWGG